MSQEAEKIKKLVAFKKKMEKRVEELESELEEQRSILKVVDSLLLDEGFKHAEMAIKPAAAEDQQVKREAPASPSPQPPPKYEKTIPLKAGTGELLANLHVTADSLNIVPAKDKTFNVNTPPFTQFLVERVLEKMQEKDNELAGTGKLTPDKAFSYEIIQEGDRIQELTVKNVDEKRLKELKSSIRWTLEKMYEKTKGQT